MPDSIIENILTTATYAPSAHHRQPWRFAIAIDLDVKKKLADAMAVEFQRDLEKDNLSKDEIKKKVTNSRNRIINAPVVIILCIDMTDMDTYPDSHRKKAEY
ncbi:MAG TPA: nitroreductase family protein, partial [Anaerolineales bacterium]|nr:nitroreductase family protein [Anaerolineales bacterium]